jgi:GNAT superfamily N-acetyltransferase
VRRSRKHGHVVPGILCSVAPESGSKSFLPRRARPEEARTIADVWLRSRYASIPAIPPPVHTDDEVRDWFASVLVSDRDVWVIAPGECSVALLVLEGEWINQLYVDPSWTGQGLGSMLVDLAKELHPEYLDLWTFQSNTAARRFYERHGFVAIDTTDGENEEHAPDVHYRWSNPQLPIGAAAQRTLRDAAVR